MLVRLLVICSVIVACKADFPPTEEYPHSAILDAQEKVKLYWKFDDVYITFEVILKTINMLIKEPDAELRKIHA